MKTMLLETIRCENGKLQRLPYHAERMARSRRLLFGLDTPLSLEAIHPPIQARKGIFKCRILYGIQVEKAEFLPYYIRPVSTLLLLAANELEYSFKFADRTAINTYFSARGAADDVLFLKNGLLTDSSYANIALWDGQRWYTPAQPLLAGTRRAALLEQGRLYPEDILPTQLKHFKELRLINAMMGLEEGPSLRIDNIKFNPPPR